MGPGEPSEDHDCSFRRRHSVRSGNRRRVTDCRWVLLKIGWKRANASTHPFSWGRVTIPTVMTVRFVAYTSVRSGNRRRVTDRRWVGFVADTRFVRGIVGALQIAVGLVSSPTLGSFGEPRTG